MSEHAITRKPEDRVTEIPSAWSDPHQVLPQVSGELRGWHRELTAIADELTVMRRRAESNQKVLPDDLAHDIDELLRRLREVNHSIGSRMQAYVLLSHELQRSEARR